MLWLFVGPTGVYLLDFFCSDIQFLFPRYKVYLYPWYEVYRGYIVFAFSVIMCVCLSVNFFSVKDISVGFLLLLYSCLFTVEPLPLLYPLLYLNLYVLGDEFFDTLLS